MVGPTGPSPQSESDFATIAYAVPTGDTLWVERFDGGSGAFDAASALGVSPDGTKVFVTGTSESGHGFDYATIAYGAPTGASLWVSRYGHGTSVPTALGVGAAGNMVFVTGSCGGSASNLDYCTLALTASTGAGVWVDRYDGPGHAKDETTSLGVSPVGTKVFVTGRSGGEGREGDSGFDYATIAYSTS